MADKMKIEAMDKKVNATIDIAKMLMAILVVGIHTEPFGFNVWLDYGFGIITRFCVPFFFVASSYFFWIKPQEPASYVKRILKLYIIWSLVYLPFDLPVLWNMPVQKILVRYLWIGNEHALWYLWASVVGFLVLYIFMQKMGEKVVFTISVLFLLIGCLKSTWAPMVNRFLPFEIHDYLGSRNGLFYAFPYIALGMMIALNFVGRKNKTAKIFWGGVVAISTVACN